MVSVATKASRELEAIKYAGRQLSIIDQLALPHETRYIPVRILRSIIIYDADVL